ncbi:heme ABC transporter ATP-binding protein, partial [Kouleothrix aurantiaca]
MNDTPPVVAMRGIVKRFPGVLASDHVDFVLRRGEIHALLGENGAGKSTLMNILAGLYRADEGTIAVHGTPASFGSPRQAIEAGIGMIHQHFMLVPSQSVTENILLGLEHPRFRLRLAENERRVAELGEQFGLKVDPRAKIWQLSVGEQQRVEILKLLYRGADVLILDEPTAVLGPAETEQLFKTLRGMTAQGKSIIFISHKLNEVVSIADRVTVMRRGKVTAADVPTASTTAGELARLMVGRDVLFRVEREAQQPGPVVLSFENLSAENDRGLPALHELSLQVHAGEIVGLAGVAGNGQRELAEVATGLRRATGGRIRLNGEDITN